MPELVEYRQIKPGYRVGSDGSVWSCVRIGRYKRFSPDWHRLRPHAQHRGHLLAQLGRGDQRFVHRLVLEAFVGPCPEGMECRHLDGNPGNNRLENLAWGTARENWEDALRHGTAALKPGGTAPRGEEHPYSKLTEWHAEMIACLKLLGVGELSAARYLGLPDAMRGAVSGVMRGQSWNHVTGFPRYQRQYDRPGRPRRVA
jgi:hypothetical protein